MSKNIKNGWEVKKLGDACDIQIGKTPYRNNKDFWGKGLPWLSISDMKDKNIYKTSEEITNKAIEECNCKIIPINTLLMSFKLSVGKLAFNKIPMCTNEAITALFIKNEKKLSNEFLYYALQSIDLYKDSDRAVKGLTLNKEKLKEIEIPLPPIEEQIKIAEILEKADKLRQKRKEANKLYDELLQSIFLDMFGDPVRNTLNFKKVLLGDYVNKITDGTHKTPKYTENGVIFLSAKDISKGYIDWNNTKFISENEHLDLVKRCNPEIDDILLSKSGSIGTAVIVDRNISFSLFESLALIKFKREFFSSKFLKYYLNNHSVKNNYLSSIKGISIKHLHLIDIRNLSILLPPIELQNKFAEIVEKIELMKEKAKKAEEEIENLFNALMQKAFSGGL